MYGEKGVEDTIKDIPYLSDDGIAFVSKAFKIPITKMKCYERKQSQSEHWKP